MTQPTIRDDEAVIRALYKSDPEREWQRMDRHRTEFAVTLETLAEHLPAPPATILDCGGGPGRYAIELVRRGYTVTLFDLSQDLLEIAARRAEEAGIRLESVEQGTATDLRRFPDASFDAVLLMGPLYHLLEEANRTQALAEAYRVVKPGGMVFATFISRYAGHIDAAAHYPERAAETSDLYHQIAETGLLPPAADGKVHFVAYFAHPREVAPLCRKVGLEVATVLGVEGVTSGREERVNLLTGKAWDVWVDMNYQIARDPSTHGGTEHLLVVSRRPRWRATLRTLADLLATHHIVYHVVGGASLALRGLPIEVHDLDLEMTLDGAHRFQQLFAEDAVLPVAWRERQDVRSYFGQFEIGGVRVEVMAGLERRRVNGEGWAPSLISTHATVDLEGTALPVIELEEEALAALRRGRLERVALILPYCDPTRFLALFTEALVGGYF